MQHFGSLTAAEREVFLSVVAPSTINPVQTQTLTQKRKKKQLPLEFTEEALYQKVVKGNNKRVEQRFLKLKNKAKKVSFIASKQCQGDKESLSTQ
ncbi:hypothetical protein CXF68_14895 [Tenacibaculum sp. Bg11-29]|nr:hypothetical protein CXF68_14895 [Tenacibaculum sp. Bg11-29]